MSGALTPEQRAVRPAFLCAGSIRTRLMWSTHPVSAVYASLIAVFGTLLGSISTYLFQQRSAAAARKERLRQERVAACSEFAAAVTNLKAGVVAAWLRQGNPDEYPAAQAEADRLGSLAEVARFRLRLVSGQPESLAKTAFDYMGTLRSASDLLALKAAEAEFEAAVSAFVLDAYERFAK
jgi:hypothetical protein